MENRSELKLYLQENESLNLKVAFKNVDLNNLMIGCVITRPNYLLNILSRCLFTDQHLLVKHDICFDCEFNPEFNPLTPMIQITKTVPLTKMDRRGFKHF